MVVVGLTLTLAPVSVVNPVWAVQAYDTAPLAVSVVLEPSHIVVELAAIFTDGEVFTVTLTGTSTKHPVDDMIPLTV